VRSLALRAVALAVSGVVVGLLWAALTPAVRGASEGIEREIGGELLLGGLGVAAGLGIALFGLWRPGPRPVPSGLMDLGGSVVASLIAWGVGRTAGAPVIVATGVLVLWPLTVAAVTAAVSLLLVLLAPDPPPLPPR
jgi:hypothetical protein